MTFHAAGPFGNQELMGGGGEEGVVQVARQGLGISFTGGLGFACVCGEA